MNILKDYKRLVNKSAELNNSMKKLQREKDLKIDTINSAYEFKIGKCLNEKIITDQLIKLSKEFVGKN